MSDVILAGDPGESFGGLEKILTGRGEAVNRLDVEITDPGFQDKMAELSSGVVISRFHEGDLASIKAMQAIRIKKPSLRFIFITGKELSAPLLTLIFNEGAYGLLPEPLSPESAYYLVKQAVKRSKWDMDEAERNRELVTLNEAMKVKTDRLEREMGRAQDIIDKMERFVYFLLSDKGFKPKAVKILFVSDSTYQRNMLEEIFSKLGFTVQGANSAEDAIGGIKEWKPDIVVSDLELPGISGVELAKEVKGKKGYPQVYFVILTAHEDKMDFILSPETMVDDCVIKPGDTENVQGMIAKILLGILVL
ncbi:MAG: response regulator [Nitrospinae bacterium]|nr:response regulator [Nitrospinota bacterium]